MQMAQKTTILSSDVGHLVRSFQTEQENNSDWMTVNKLRVSPAKTEHLLIGNPRRPNNFAHLSPLFLEKNEINRANKTKYVGVMVNDKLN